MGDSEPTLAAIYFKVKATADKVDDIHTTVHGPPGEPHKGMVVRQDRTEQFIRDAKESAEKKDKRWWGVASAMVIIVGETIWSWVSGIGRS